MKIDELVERDSPFCAPGETLQQAVERMCLWECDVLAVCDADRRLVGTITSRAVCRSCLTGASLQELHVADVRRDETLFGCIGDSPGAVVDRMIEHRTWQLPVVDGEGRLVGSVSYHKLLRWVSGAADILLIVEESRRLEEVAAMYEPTPRWTLVTRHRELTAPDGVGSKLSRAETRLLLALAETSGTVIGRDALTRSIARRAWHPTDRYVDVLVANLRKKFRERASAARIIRTVPSEGYLLSMRVFDERGPHAASAVRRLEREPLRSVTAAAAAG